MKYVMNKERKNNSVIKTNYNTFNLIVKKFVILIYNYKLLFENAQIV